MSSFKFASNSLQHRFNAKLQRDRPKYFIYFQYKIYTSDRAFGMNISFAKHQELIFKTPRHVLVLHELIHENIAATGWFFSAFLCFSLNICERSLWRAKAHIDVYTTQMEAILQTISIEFIIEKFTIELCNYF